MLFWKGESRALKEVKDALMADEEILYCHDKGVKPDRYRLIIPMALSCNIGWTILTAYG